MHKQTIGKQRLKTQKHEKIRKKPEKTRISDPQNAPFFDPSSPIPEKNPENLKGLFFGP